MPDIKGMLPVGVIVITAIVALFVLAVVLLLYLSARYKFLSAAVAGSGDKSGGFLRYVKEDFSQAYKKYGQEVNTPALVANAVSVKLPGLLLIERFINNAVSLFVTLGLFGTFLGLSLSVSSLTELIGYSNTDQWLSVLDSVGTGLMSALSGMGVAFYTSLAGVACSIILTLLRSVFSPQAQREKLETQVELWLDHDLAPTLPTERAKDDVQLVHQMIRALDSAAASMDRTLKQSTDEMKLTLSAAKEPLAEFSRTVEGFNEGVRDFSEVDPQALGAKAAREAAEALHGSPVPAGSYRIILRWDAMQALMETFCGIFSAENAQQGMSLLNGREGEAIAAPCVTLMDDPLLPGGFSSYPFDDEGVACRTKAVVEAGVLKTLLHNRKTAKKQGIASTGNAARMGLSAPVTVAPSNLFFQPGTQSLAEMEAQMGDGLVITDLSGLHAGANTTSGDFSLLSKGYLLEGGKRVRPVEQITVAGNFYQLLKNIRALGNDLTFPASGVGAPSVDVGTLAVSGK